jgi:D-alanine-D-alanine ligase
MRPAAAGSGLITNRRGARRYRLTVEGTPLRPGQVARQNPVLRWTWDKLERMARLSSSKDRLSVATMDIRAERHPMMVPHRVTISLIVTYFQPADAESTEKQMRTILGKSGPRWTLTRVSDRPPMRERASNLRLAKAVEAIASEYGLPTCRESSTWPSVAGLVPARTGCICGIGPVARDRGTSTEAVQRISLVQRTLLVGEFLASQLHARDRKKS